MTDKSNTEGRVPEALRDIQRFNNFAGLMNPESRGLYVRYEDHAAQIATLRTQQPAPAGAAPVTEADIQAAREHIADVHNGEQMRSALSQLRREVVVELAARGFVPADYATPQPAPATQQAGALDEQGFRDWVLRNLPKGSVIGNGEWWADHLTSWAKRFVKAAPQPSPTAQAAESVPAVVQADTNEPTYLCKAWGETDLPSAAIVRGLDGIRAFLIAEWLGDADAEDYAGEKTLPAVMDEMQEDWAREGKAFEWSTEFEIGGISVQRVDDVGAARAPAESAPAGAPVWQGKWAWVPVEPSTAMLIAGNHGQPGEFSALKVWQDMLEALQRSSDYTRPVDPPIAPAESVGRDAERLEQIADAIRDYHHALDTRKHGGLAESAAFNSICQTMGMHWEQGKEATRRAAMAANGGNK